MAICLESIMFLDFEPHKERNKLIITYMRFQSNHTTNNTTQKWQTPTCFYVSIAYGQYINNNQSLKKTSKINIHAHSERQHNHETLNLQDRYITTKPSRSNLFLSPSTKSALRVYTSSIFHPMQPPDCIGKSI